MVMVMLMVMVRVMAMEMATMLFFKHIMTIRSTSTQKVTHSNAPRVQVLGTAVLSTCTESCPHDGSVVRSLAESLLY